MLSTDKIKKAELEDSLHLQVKVAREGATRTLKIEKKSADHKAQSTGTENVKERKNDKRGTRNDER